MSQRQGKRAQQPNVHDELAGQAAAVLSMLDIDPDALRTHVRCPLGTHPDKHPSFRVVSATNRWFCSCTVEGASLVDLVIARKAATDFREAVALLRRSLRLGSPGPARTATPASSVAKGTQGGYGKSHTKLTAELTATPTPATPRPAAHTAAAKAPSDAVIDAFDRLLAQCEPAGHHPYLARKRVAPVHAVHHRATGRLVLRIHDPSDQTVGLQFIGPDGKKSCAKGSVLAGNGLVLGVLRDSKYLGVTEGWATGVAVYSLFNLPVLVTFGASNMAHALQRFLLPDQEALIYADHDQPGLHAAALARVAIGPERCKILTPKAAGLDFNDLLVDASKSVAAQSHIF